jgi:hypothetical protein
MKVTFKIWDPENQEEEGAEEAVFDSCYNSFDIDSAPIRVLAQSFMEKRWADNDYVPPMYVSVRTPGGALLEFEVHAEECSRLSSDAPRFK